MTYQLIQRHKQECKTPKEVLDSLKNEFGNLFDPCPINPNFNGLEIEWEDKTYVNPPYNNIHNWLQKAHSQLSKNNCSLIIFLLPVDTSTKWFHNYVLGQAEIRFIKGRLRFIDNKPAPFASMICIFRSSGVKL
jgi:site-specific DNA-methyltransferase (adenine-specific)